MDDIGGMVELFSRGALDIVVLAFFMIRDIKFLDSMRQTLTSLDTTLKEMKGKND